MASCLDNLPPGWRYCSAENSGGYYWHLPSGTIQIGKPSENEVSPISPPLSPLDIVDSGNEQVSFAQPVELLTNKSNSKTYRTFNFPRHCNPFNDTPICDIAAELIGSFFVGDKSHKQTQILSEKHINDIIEKAIDGKKVILSFATKNFTIVDAQTHLDLTTIPLISVHSWKSSRRYPESLGCLIKDVSESPVFYVFRFDKSPTKLLRNIYRLCREGNVEQRQIRREESARLVRSNTVTEEARTSLVDMFRMKSTPSFDEFGGLSKTSGILRNNNSSEEKCSIHYSPLSFSIGTDRIDSNIEKSHSFHKNADDWVVPFPAVLLGVQKVSHPTGLNILNEAVDTIIATGPQEIMVDIHVSPSSVSIFKNTLKSLNEFNETATNKKDSQLICECRTRFLSFMGISAKSEEYFGFIMTSACSDTLGRYDCFVFRCKESAGPLCSTIEAACSQRLQRYLDSHNFNKSHNTSSERLNQIENFTNKGNSSRWKNWFSMFN